MDGDDCLRGLGEKKKKEEKEELAETEMVITKNCAGKKVSLWWKREDKRSEEDSRKGVEGERWEVKNGEDKR